MIGRSCGALSGISECRAVCDPGSLSKLRPGCETEMRRTRATNHT